VHEMKIGIIMGNTGLTRSGTGNYIFNLIRELEKHQNIELSLITYRVNSLFPALAKIVPKYPFFYVTVLWSQALSLQKNLLDGLDIIHNPAHFYLINKPGKRYVCTIHDLTPVLFPAWHPLWKVWFSRYFFPRLVKNSDKIIADSLNTKQDLINYYSVSPGKIAVIYLGTAPEFQPLPKSEVASIRDKYDLKNPFVLFVGNIEPRKNIPTLLKAFSICRKKLPKLKLVIVGQKGWKYDEVYTTIAGLRLENEVIFLHYVPHDDLPAIYNAAELFVYPSLYEGFGLPPLEAMQCGVPVITSNTSSLPEIVGENGAMVSPYDVQGLVDLMSALLIDPHLREENIRNGLSRAKMFSWEKCAQQTRDVYEELYNRVAPEEILPKN
jgi:glycosyltransferase involved in cell wall biosynthesis